MGNLKIHSHSSPSCLANIQQFPKEHLLLSKNKRSTIGKYFTHGAFLSPKNEKQLYLRFIKHDTDSVEAFIASIIGDEKNEVAHKDSP